MLLKTGKITASKFIPYLLLLLYSIAAFHQVAFLKATFKWDYISYYFPVRYYVSECIRHGNMPLWMIYEGCGYPLYGDPQSGAWYPVVWIISLIHGYDIYAASFEFMLTIFIAGAGFYTLASGLKISRTVSFITAVAYMSCGFFIGNAQHLTLLISGAYLPFIIHFYMRFISELHYRDALCTALFLFLMFTGGYPAIFFILFYFLLIIFIIKLIRRIYVSDRDFVKKFLSLHLLMIISFLLMSAVFLVSIFQCMPYSTRGGPITLDDALLYAFTPQSMLSFITPFALQRNTPFFNTDVSMSNGYFGIVFLILLIYSLFDRKSKLQFLFLILSIIFLAASLGSATPMRTWLYDFVPLMNYFRYPSIFRVFFILLFILLTGFSIDAFVKKFHEEKRKIILLLSIAILFFLAVIIIAQFKNSSGNTISDAFRNWQYFLKHSSVYDHIIFQSIIQILLLTSVLVVIAAAKKSKVFLYVLVFIASSDMFIATQLNINFTVLTEDLSPKHVAEKINIYPAGFPLPDAKLISEHNDNSQELSPLWQNLNIFFKQPAPDGYIAFLLSSFSKFIDSNLQEKIFDNPFCYFPKNILPYAALADSVTNPVRAQNLYLDESNYNLFNEFAFPENGMNKCSVTRLEPNHISISASAEKNCLMVILQNNFPGWKAKINGKDAQLLTGNYTFMAVPLSAGENSVELVFQPALIPLSASISITTLLLICGLILYSLKKSTE